MVFVLVIQGVVFAVWAFCAFRSLFRIRARAVAETGRAFPGMAATLRAFRDFVVLHQYQSERRILLLLTVVLLGLSIAFASARHTLWGW